MYTLNIVLNILCIYVYYKYSFKYTIYIYMHTINLVLNILFIYVYYQYSFKYIYIYTINIF